ncbi:MAG TPA: hybrid sensor histidine kinase/response regulator [Chloroflexi bacterium]|nr:hybrid sensor histidine kinase/response regulator [Chloroflexota bacterium]
MNPLNGKQTTGATILVVDDDEVVLSSVADLLRISGYRVLTATNGVHALQILQSQTPDLIVADIMMPRMNGYQFYKAVRDNPSWTSIPFIFLTARDQQKDIREGYSLGADHYLTKPFEPEDLLVAVEARLKRMQAIQSVIQADVEDAKEQLLTVFSHELRTPLSYIYGYVHLLREGRPTLDDEATDYLLDSIQRGTERVVKLVEDLMLIVHIDSGAAEMEVARHRSPTNLSFLIERVVAGLQEEAQERNVAISMLIPKELKCFCRPVYAEDIFKRVIENAIRFSKPEGGEVWIRAGVEGDRAVITVEDNGIGIAPERLPHLFGHARQIEQGDSDQEEGGGGLGLAIACRLVQLHGGDIQVSSQPGEGTVFTISLPLAPGADAV